MGNSDICSEFRTKVPEYLCSDRVLFSDKIPFLTSHFWQNFLVHSKGIVVLSLNVKRYFCKVIGV